jgi:hypothetical protein
MTQRLENASGYRWVVLLVNAATKVALPVSAGTQAYPLTRDMQIVLLVFMVGQVSGILFVLGMNRIGVVPLLWLFMLLAVAGVGLCSRLTESEIE